ncbi:MAG: hypothetical protein Q4C34_08545 [Bacteroidales bacterium]|nr:hypothetical protein [Bacteroidales bacterium]
MKIINSIKMLAVMCAMALAFTSCFDNNDNNDDELITVHPMHSCYAAVTNIATGETTYSKEMAFALTLNWTTGNASFQFTGLMIDGKNQGILDFKNLAFKSNETTHICSISAPGVTGGNQQVGVTSSLTSVELKWLDRLDYGNTILNNSQRYEPMFVFSFVLDNKYRVVGSRQPFLLNGTTTSTSQRDGSSYDNDKSSYSVALDFDKMTATISITGAQFVANMPAQNMTFPSLPFTIADDGTITIEKAEFIPTIANTPQEEFPISDLKAVVIPSTGMVLDFSCNVRKVMMYDVHANVDYTSYKKK